MSKEDQQKLLALSVALVYTVRNQIPYSENIDLFFPVEKQGQFYFDRKKILSQNRLQYGVSNIQAVLQSKVGYCDELSFCALRLASLININDLGFKGKFYLSRAGFESHVFCFLHRSERLKGLNNGEMTFDGLESLLRQEDLNDAIILDPWIYKATELANYQAHLSHAKKFGVENYYTGDIQSDNCMVELTDHPVSPRSGEEKKLLESFQIIYETIIKCLKTGKLNLIEEGGLPEEIQKSLDNDIVFIKKLVIEALNQLEPFQSLNLNLWELVCDQTDQFLDEKNRLLNEICNSDSAYLNFKKIIDTAPDFLGDILSWAKTDAQNNQIINALCIMNNNGWTGWAQVACSKPESLAAFLDLAQTDQQKNKIFNAFFPFGFNIQALFWYPVEAQRAMIHFIGQSDFLKEHIINQLNGVDNIGLTGWVQIAYSKPESLAAFLDLAQTDPQKNQIIQALCQKNSNGETGFSLIINSSPNNLTTIINWKKELNEKIRLFNTIFPDCMKKGIRGDIFYKLPKEVQDQYVELYNQKDKPSSTVTPKVVYAETNKTKKDNKFDCTIQ